MQGLQIFDENGNCTLDITSRLTRYIGELTISRNTDSGEITNDLFLTNDFWIIVVEITNPYFGKNYSRDEITHIPLPIFEKEGNIVKWSYEESDVNKRTGCKIRYGVY